ncbi:MAG: helicase HerA domain-containing protein, partial [Halobacteriaceae archaeon]
MTDSDLGDWTDRDDAEASGADGDQAETDFRESDVAAAGAPEALGVLAVSEGLRITEEGEDTSLRAYVTTDRRDGVRIGSYVIAEYHDGELLFGRVTGLEYVQAFAADDATEIHARRAMRTTDIDEADYKFIAELEPVAVVFEQDGELTRRMPDRVPRPETVVREADDVARIKTGLNIPSNGVFLGHLAVGGERIRTGASPPTIDYRLRDEYAAGDPLVFRHTLVAGGTGSGKTHLAKNVLRQYLASERTYPVESGADREPRAAVVQFDPQDEYAQMHDDNPSAGDAERRQWERQNIAYGGVEDTLAFIPDVAGARYGADHHRAEQVRFSIPFEMVEDQPYLATGGGLNENQYPALLVLLDLYFGQTETPTYDGFCSFLDDQALRAELDESGRVHEATFDAV